MNAGSTAITPARRAAAARAIAAFFNQAAANSDALRIESLADSLEYQTFALRRQESPRIESV